MASDELFFLRRELPDEIKQGYRWSLTKVKLQKDGAYFAFRTRELADRAAERLGNGQESVAATELNSEHYYDFATDSAVVLFESTADLDAFLANRGEYRLESLLRRYSTKDGLPKLAV